MKSDEPLPYIIRYIQKDLGHIKVTIDRCLRPFKSEVKGLTNSNLSLRGDLSRAREDQEKLMRLIAEKAPDLLDEAIALLADPRKRGFKTLRKGWVERLSRR
jgi:hypothetical protein